VRYLIVRLGGYGDCLIVTPLFSYLKNLGHEVYVLTSEQGMEVFKENPHIDRLIYHERHSVENAELEEYFRKVQAENACDELIDLCESLEEKHLFHPTNPQYNYPKNERMAVGNVNFYDSMFESAGFSVTGRLPEMYFAEAEEEAFQRNREAFLGKFLVVWCLSGSSLHKAYPYTHIVMQEIIKKHPDVVFVTVGDEACQILELALQHEQVIHKSGKWSFRETALACKYASLVVAPETGVIHLAGCFDTPKFCFLTHTTRECVTKYFKNDYSLQADVACSPCFRIIYEAAEQCPIEHEAYAPFCTAMGFAPIKLIRLFDRIYDEQAVAA